MTGKKRGRPPTGGVKPGWMLIRAGIVLAEFERQRRAGVKYSAAIEATVAEFRSLGTDRPISAVEVKRILAEHQPSAATGGFLAERDGNKKWALKIGAPYRDRVNRKDRKKKGDT